MKKTKYVYNEKTLQFEKYKVSKSEFLVRTASYSFLTIIGALSLFFLVNKYFPSPAEKALARENSQMSYYYKNISSQLDLLTVDLEKLHEKDANVHRMIFGIDPIDQSIWNGGIGGVKRFTDLESLEESGEMISESLQRVEKLKRKIQLQNNSLDTLYHLALEKEERLAAIPSIKPVLEDKLKRRISSLSGYGIRLHPVHKVKKFHKGIDFTAPRGTAIQATGNGTVKRVEKRKSGYGLNVIIDHGYGYSTLYAHMQSVDVKRGEKVKKGQKIGTIGSTGTSTAPHLHYEVRIKGKAVNPIDYCLDGLSPEEYKELVSKAAEQNQSFD